MFKEYFTMALRSLWTHKARSMLTMLGVVIGVSSVILLVSLGDSARSKAVSEVEGLGSNLVYVSVRDPKGYLPSVWLDDLKGKADIDAYSPVVGGAVTYTVDGADFKATVDGVNQLYPKIANLTLEKGRFFKGIDIENSAAVAVIGSKVKERLFPSADAVGGDIVVKGIPFKIVGVLQSKGTTFTGDFDKIVYIPAGFAEALFPSSGGRKTYYASSVGQDTAENTRLTIERYLSRRLPSDDLYTVFSQTQVLTALNTIMGLLTTLLAGIAAISLIVGGIGIMNIMLVTVRERTREIGVRKALGARRSYILWQFLVESVLITVFGGLFGLAASAVGSAVISVVSGLKVTIGPGAAGIALAFSVAVGIVFGLYPAGKAASLEPVEALRFE